MSRVAPTHGLTVAALRGLQGGEGSRDRGHAWGQWQSEEPRMAPGPLGSPPPGRGLGWTPGGWAGRDPGPGRVAGASGGPTGGGPAGRLLVCPRRAAPAGLVSGNVVGWEKAREAERPCLPWRLVEAPPAFHSLPSPSTAAPLPSLASRKPGGRPAEHFVPGIGEHLATPAKPQARGTGGGRDTQSGHGGQVGGGSPWAPWPLFPPPLAAPPPTPGQSVGSSGPPLPGSAPRGQLSTPTASLGSAPSESPAGPRVLSG